LPPCECSVFVVSLRKRQTKRRNHRDADGAAAASRAPAAERKDFCLRCVTERPVGRVTPVTRLNKGPYASRGRLLRAPLSRRRRPGHRRPKPVDDRGSAPRPGRSWQIDSTLRPVRRGAGGHFGRRSTVEARNGAKAALIQARQPCLPEQKRSPPPSIRSPQKDERAGKNTMGHKSSRHTYNGHHVLPLQLSPSKRLTGHALLHRNLDLQGKNRQDDATGLTTRGVPRSERGGKAARDPWLASR